MTESKIVSVLPLKGSNYAVWKLQCQMALMKDGLWGIVNETDKAPASSATEAEKTKWRSRKDRALATIVLSVDPSILYLLGEPTEPVDVWKKLKSQFQKKTWANKLVLRRKLYSLRLKEGESVQEHIKKLTEIFNELTAIEAPLEEEDKVVQLLASLPESYDTLVTALEASEKVPEMDTVIERLLYEERKTQERHSETTRATDQTEALATKSKPKWKRGIRCHNCGKLGHIQKECYTERVERSSKQAERPKNSKSYLKNQSTKPGNSVGLIASTHVLAAKSSQDSTVDWILDSGATCHICCNKSMFQEIQTLDTPQIVTLGDGRHIEAFEQGKVEVKLIQEDNSHKIGILHDVLYVPDLSYNLLSIAKTTSLNKTVRFDQHSCEILNEAEQVIGTAVKYGSLYYLKCDINSQNETVNVNTVKSSTSIWHHRYGHLNVTSLRKLASEQLVKGLKKSDVSDDMDLCESCIQGKSHRTPFPSAGSRQTKLPLELVHSDVCGKINTKSLSGGEYFLTFVDDHTRYTWIYILKHKSQVFQCFQEWKAMVERSSGQKVITLRTDNGGEYTSGEFRTYLTKEGIKHEFTVPRSPEQNGVAERLNRTLVEAVRSMLSGAKLPQRFWAEALSTAVYLRNRSPTKAISGLTPYEGWTGRKPAVNHFKVFGCVSYAHIAKEERKKLDYKAKRCILLGYGTNVKGYRLYNSEEKKVFYSRDVVFDEKQYGLLEKDEVSNETECSKHLIDVELELNEGDSNQETTETNESVTNEEPIESAAASRRQSTREKRKPDFYGVWVNNVTNQYQEPMTFREASQSSDRGKWIEAMEREMASLKANNVYDLVELPKGKQAIGSKWVYKRKLKADGSIERYKSRLVAQGFSQRAGQDYYETFSPVIRFESIRSIIALAVQNNMLLHQMDVTSAFLNGDLEDEVYMKQPEGFEEKDKEHLVCRLKRSLYGLKQAPRCWNIKLNNLLKEMKFQQSNSDPCLYISSEGELCILAVYVDDILIATKTKERLTEVKQKLTAKFEVKDLGDLHYLLGVSINQDHTENSVWIGQPTYTLSILEKFGMKDAKPVTTPVASGTKLTKVTQNDEFADIDLYQSAVGSLQYLSTMTRPDIAFAVSNVAKYCSSPTKEHWIAVKRIMRYLKGTHNLGLLYKKHVSSSCIGFSDSDWAGDVDDRKSTSGYVFQVGGTSITWRSRKQSCVALSTAEAEYVALSQAGQEALWLRQLFNDLQNEPEGPTVLHEDNQAAICLAKNPQSHGKSKHIEIKYHFIREQVNNKAIELKYCQTGDMIADMLTKGLAKEQFEKLRKLAGLCVLSSFK